MRLLPQGMHSHGGSLPQAQGEISGSLKRWGPGCERNPCVCRGGDERTQRERAEKVLCVGSLCRTVSVSVCICLCLCLCLCVHVRIHLHLQEHVHMYVYGCVRVCACTEYLCSSATAMYHVVHGSVVAGSAGLVDPIQDGVVPSHPGYAGPIQCNDVALCAFKQLLYCFT